LALSTLAIGQANDLDPVATLGVQRDSAAGAPNEITGVGGYDKPGLLVCHCAALLLCTGLLN
jgi:hypothetical protein